jgi:uncharacterized repeat protein (TIGR04052 family)
MVLLACAVSLSLGGCTAPEQPVQLRFTLRDANAVHRLQFYLHDIVLISEAGKTYPLSLKSHAPWQSDRVALLDFAGATTKRAVVEGSAMRDRYTGVRFVIGVPFDLNHANQLTATAPLDRADMFWSWQSGYKFLRLDLAAGEHEAAFHLGSTGCSSASVLRPPQQPCAQPNRIRVELTGFDPLTQPIEMHVSEIVAALGANETRACTGDYSQASCAQAFAATGLDALTGECLGAGDAAERPCMQQRLFTVRR